MASLGTLPEELMIEILLWLPPESLMQFKCVCKLWYALINDSKFTTKHFANSLQCTNFTHSSVIVLLMRAVIKDSGEEVDKLSFITYPNVGDRYASVVDIDLPFLRDFPYFEIHGHSHGIICLSNRYKDIVLCNPATREWHKLPPSILLLTETPKKIDGYDAIPNAVGFGYDSKLKDLKVVRVVTFAEGPCIDPLKVEVYDLNKGRWREIESPVCATIFWAPSFEMHYKEVYYWWATNDESKEIILSFDMADEVFRQILVPESFEEECDKFRSLGVWNGSIVLFNYSQGGDEAPFDIWVMDHKDESGRVSWSKLLTIGPVSGIDMPLVFVSSDELLMITMEGQVVSCNINTQHFKQLTIKEHATRFNATVFIKSLLSVKGGNNFNFEI